MRTPRHRIPQAIALALVLGVAWSPPPAAGADGRAAERAEMIERIERHARKTRPTPSAGAGSTPACSR